MGAKAEQLGRLKSGADVLRVSMSLDGEAAALSENAQDPAGDHWIHVLPAGPLVSARDGRKFTVEKLDEIIRRTETPMLVDWEHKSEKDDTRAAGWIDEFKVDTAAGREGIWGKVSWTKSGREHVANRDYRFISPVVLGRRANGQGTEKGMFTVERFASVALTNRPALKMHGIEAFRSQFSERFGPFASGEDAMDQKIMKALCSRFGIAEDADADAVVAAIEAEKKKGTTSDAQRDALSVLTEERNEARESLAAMQAELKTFREKSFTTEVHAFFDQGGREGKIPPASREKWLNTALKSAEHFAMFKDDIYPGLVPSGTSQEQQPGKRRAKLSGKSTTGADYDALKSLGLTDKQIRESEAEVFNLKGQVITDAGDDDDDDDEGDDEPSKPADKAQGG